MDYKHNFKGEKRPTLPSIAFKNTQIVILKLQIDFLVV